MVKVGKYGMRWREITEEVWGTGRRFWISPEGIGYDLSKDGFLSHDQFIYQHPELFEIDPNEYRQPGGRCYVVALALERGWVRVATDLKKHTTDMLAISACDKRHAAKGIRWLHQRGIYPTALQIEIEKLRGREPERTNFFFLRNRAIDLFARNGVVPRGVVHEGFAEQIPRLWLGPKGEAINLDIDWTSHHRYVIQHPKVFGVDIEKAANPDYEPSQDVPENDRDEFRYYENLAVALAEMNGWVRVSHDIGNRYGPSMILLSASNIKAAHRALVWLHRHSYFPQYIEIELERLNRDHVVPIQHTVLDNPKDIDFFYRTGKLRAFAQLISAGHSSS